MRKYLYALAGMTMLLAGCGQEALPEAGTPATPDVGNETTSPGGLPGIAYVKVPESASVEIHEVATRGLTKADTKLTRALTDANTDNLEPLFPIDPRFEKRMRERGLDRWFIVKFDEGQDLDSTLKLLEESECFEFVEKTYATSLPDVRPLTYAPAMGMMSRAEKEYPFNDENLPAQWHYHNTGATPNSVAGADINLFEAWKYTTGDPKVIVSVNDGGIDVNHEDLAENIWVNEGEIPDDGIDNDNNGFIDDVNGYNFATNSGKITVYAGSGHGTHVAGTIAARNGNGKGVCGIAGGDEAHPGARLMSCQKFADNGSGVAGEQAFVYAANNGSVISQNSWGYTYPGPGELPESMKEAIDYFIDYAGCDNEGNQLPDSPMKGGIVIFAAGNNGKDYDCYPGAYERVLSVSAMAPDWTVAFYSNKGAWVDIMAPGGDLRSQYGENGIGQVLSTLPPAVYRGVGYGYMQGTSMACPHVSGIAALVVSKFGGQGFTNTELRARLEGAIHEVSIDEKNPDYSGRLGVGYIDAGKVFAENGGTAPYDVTDLSAKADFTTIEFKWTAVADSDDGAPVKYNLYLSENAINTSGLKNIIPIRVNAMGVKPGETMTYTVGSLTPGKKFHAAIVAVDRWGQMSATPRTIETATKENHAPEVSGVPEDIVKVKGSGETVVPIVVSDRDGHSISFKLGGDTRGVTATRDGNTIEISFRALAKPGKYTVTLNLVDELRASTDVTIPYEITKAEPPVIIEEMEDQVLDGSKGESTFDLGKYFSFEEGTSFSASSTDDNIVKASVSGTSLTLTPVHPGKAIVSVKATNDKESAGFDFNVKVFDDNQSVISRIFPQPATTELNIEFAYGVKKASVAIRDMLGAKVYDRVHVGGSDKVAKIDISGLPAGTYTLIFECEQGKARKTFIKQ